MRGSSRRTSRNKAITRAFVVVCIVLMVVLFFPRVLGGVASIVITPLVYVQGALFTGDGYIARFVQSRNSLMEENIALRHALAQYSDASLTIDYLRDENSKLRSLLGDNEEKDRILATVLDRPPLTPYDVVVIDRGSEDGIQLHAPVYISDSTVIGFVSRVEPRSAVVVLATSPGLESTAYVVGADVYTTAEGRGGGILRVSMPQGIDLNEGDKVVLPGLGRGVFGVIDTIESVDAEPLQYGYITPPQPISSYRYVSVGSSYDFVRYDFESVDTAMQELRKKLLTIDVPKDELFDSAHATGTTATSTD